MPPFGTDNRATVVKGLHDAALDAGQAAMAAALELGFPVRLIGTFEGLVTCRIDDRLSQVLERADTRPFDQLPVIDDGRIVGLLRLVGLDAARADGRVSDVLERIDERLLIAADASILAFLLGAKTSPCRLILDGDRITGLVGRSDLQKLPVRSLLFHLVTHLELAMAAWIRRHFAAESEWLDLLTSSRRTAVEKRYQGLHAARFAVDRLTATMLADKRAVILRSAALPMSRNRAKAEMEMIEALRDAVVHIGDYALTQDAADRMIEMVALVRQWTELLPDLVPKAPGSQRD